MFLVSRVNTDTLYSRLVNCYKDNHVHLNSVSPKYMYVTYHQNKTYYLRMQFNHMNTERQVTTANSIFHWKQISMFS